jgi:hypothetical protein
MKNIKIDNERQLATFLKLVSQEAYKKSLRESDDPFIQKYKLDMKNDKKIYGALDEVEEAEEEFPEESDDQPVDADMEPEETEIKQVSYDSVKSAINNLRAGKSLKIPDLEQSMRDYYDRLDEKERLVLFTFLEELSKILNMTISGEEAQDVSDPPVSITMQSGDEVADEEAEADTSELPGEELEDTGEEEAEEDTAPPIAVNESQNKKELIRKIRYLMAK